MAKKYIDAEKLKAEIERRMDKHWEGLPDADSPEDDWTRNELCELGAYKELEHIEDFLNSIQQEQENVAERFARIVRGNLIGIDKEVQQKFEQLYFEVTGNKMYGGYND